MSSQEVIKKRNKLFFSFIAVVIIFLTAMILVAIYVDDYNDMTLINIIIVIALMVISLFFRNILFGYNNMARIAKVVLSQGNPIKFTYNIVENPDVLLNDGFSIHANNSSYSIYYKIVVDNSLKIKNIRLLYLVLILKKPQLDFYNKNLHEDIQKLESTFQKKSRPTKYIITAFKEVHNISDTTIKEIGEVVSYSQKRQSFNQINVGLYNEDHKAYFLYSEKYNPSYYYKLGIDFIKKIITK
ncbi:MAG: hypothetical protein WCR19_04640 [Acholeplasmataceae bacterium]